MPYYHVIRGPHKGRVVEDSIRHSDDTMMCCFYPMGGLVIIPSVDLYEVPDGVYGVEGSRSKVIPGYGVEVVKIENNVIKGNFNHRGDS